MCPCNTMPMITTHQNSRQLKTRTINFTLRCKWTHVQTHKRRRSVASSIAVGLRRRLLGVGVVAGVWLSARRMLNTMEGLGGGGDLVSAVLIATTSARGTGLSRGHIFFVHTAGHESRNEVFRSFHLHIFLLDRRRVYTRQFEPREKWRHAFFLSFGQCERRFFNKVVDLKLDTYNINTSKWNRVIDCLLAVNTNNRETNLLEAENTVTLERVV